MKRLLLVAALGANAVSAESLCEAARADVERYAQHLGLQADVRCRGLVGRPVSSQAELQGMGPPEGVAPQSGPLAWPVRVTEDGVRAYVQRVPLTVIWTAPAWVAAHDLVAGARLQTDDLVLQDRRWPEGLRVQPARADQPPLGRLRQALRTGDLISATALLPLDTLQRGDPVTAVLTEGAVDIRLPAHLLGPARVGERARVQVSGRSSALEGRLTDLQTLLVDAP